MVRIALSFACLYLLVQNLTHVYTYTHIPWHSPTSIRALALKRSVELFYNLQLRGVASDIPDLVRVRHPYIPRMHPSALLPWWTPQTSKHADSTSQHINSDPSGRNSQIGWQ